MTGQWRVTVCLTIIKKKILHIDMCGIYLIIDKVCSHRPGCGSRSAPSKGKASKVAKLLDVFQP
jgi:hypothetical protein